LRGSWQSNSAFHDLSSSLTGYLNYPIVPHEFRALRYCATNLGKQDSNLTLRVEFSPGQPARLYSAALIYLRPIASFKYGICEHAATAATRLGSEPAVSTKYPANTSKTWPQISKADK